MRGTSQKSFEIVKDTFSDELTQAGADAVTVAHDIFTVVDAVDDSLALGRALSDPSRSAADKISLVEALLGENAQPLAKRILKALVAQRWSAASDFGSALSLLAIDSYLAAAESEGALAKVESELFQITRSLIGFREAREAITAHTSDPSRRVQLVDDILAGRVNPITLAICQRAALRPRGERFIASLLRVGELAAARRKHIVANITVGKALNDQQIARLEAVLSDKYQSAVQLNITTDARVVGGIRIQVGPDVIDSTVLTRLVNARRQLAS